MKEMVRRKLKRLLAKDAEFEFDDACLEVFNMLKRALVSAPVLQPPNQAEPFEIMCDAIKFTVGAVLGQRKEDNVGKLETLTQ